MTRGCIYTTDKPAVFLPWPPHRGTLCYCFLEISAIVNVKGSSCMAPAELIPSIT